MRILITNDDSISSPILPGLIRWAKTKGDVTVVVPKVEQSGKSQAIEFYHAVEVKEVNLAPDLKVWAMNSTPADCVRFGVLGLHQTYDLVLSGINKGLNVGHDIVYSGTVGAIYEASRLGIHGIALSSAPEDLEHALAQLDRVWEWMTHHELLSHNLLYNVNFPREAKGIRVTRQGGVFFSDGFQRQEGDMYIQVGAPVTEYGQDLNMDIDAIRNGYVSVTPLAAERTNFVAFEKLKHLT
ncbi:MAG: 5'/3'-nucleotidase SurE [Clostridia bacterium]|nr:5'/3'-nucleotidase SurE [Clostridia bacterium]